MLRESRGCSGAFSRACVVAVWASFIVVFFTGSAIAFPTPGNTNITSVGVIPGAEIEQINVTGHYSNTSVYMGPYSIGISGSPIVEYMMCFNAAAAASTGRAVATDTVGASGYFGVDAAAKISMVAWLASQWQADITSPAAIARNADINKAMWEVMADYTSNPDNNHGLAVDGSVPSKGTFYLNANDGDIDDVTALLGLALGHTTDNTSANFLIPVTDTGAYDSSKQPFVQPVPEPATLLLLGSGLAGTGLWRWRRRNRA